MSETLTADRLRELLAYDRETGAFTWKVARGRGVMVGDIAGYTHSGGYRYIGVCGRNHRAHRLAWLWVHGVWPAACLDHRNGVRSDNRIVNLREATIAENAQNRLQVASDNTSGHPGVSWRKDRCRWRAFIHLDGRQHHLGHYATAEEAAAAYLVAKAKLHPFATERHAC